MNEPTSDFYSELSVDMFGVHNAETRRKAKAMAFANLYGGPLGNVDFADIEVKVAEDRMQRVGLRTYKVRVYSDTGTDYTVVATSELDARCLAFVLDGGCEAGLTDFYAGHVELALTWTKVL